MQEHLSRQFRLSVQMSELVDGTVEHDGYASANEVVEEALRM
jgi:Arc/MetJ-type ribon-helix-helix transcriptional regulator